MRVDTAIRGSHRWDVAVSLSLEKLEIATIVRLSGRLDAHGAAEIGPAVAQLGSRGSVVVDAAEVSYLSSAGIRVFLELHKRLTAEGSRVFFASLQPYCLEVIKVAALDRLFAIRDTVGLALAEITTKQEVRETPCGRFVFQEGSREPGSIEVLGHIEDVLASRIMMSQVRDKKFSAKAYSLGLGGLGRNVEEVMPLMGEMMTMGGTMVWLPTDGNDTPDFLVPQHDSDEVLIRTAFNVSIAGKFNEYVVFESLDPEGVALSELYRALFDLSKQRRPDYRGALALAMRAEVGQVYGSGAVKAPIAVNAPKNGRWITDPENYPEWFEVDETPRLHDTTGLICGIGVDLEADLSVFNQEYLNATFYINPGNKNEDARGKLHNHGVFFKPFPLGEKPWTLEKEIQSVVEQGQFVDMRHLFDKTTVIWALIGLIYAQDFRPDSNA